MLHFSTDTAPQFLYKGNLFFPITSPDDCILLVDLVWGFVEPVGCYSDRCFVLSFSVGREPDWKAVPQRLLETITEEDQVEDTSVITKGNFIYLLFIIYFHYLDNFWLGRF